MSTKRTEEEKIKAAHALNLWTVSISQIIDYDDINVLEQEYDTIMNNLNLENMPKDEALLDVIKEIMDEVTNLRIDEGDKKLMEREYQHQLKNAVWSAVPNVTAIFASSDPIAMSVTLATQVGIGYMNYRRNKAEYELRFEGSQWHIQHNRMQHLNALQKQLFETAWRLADEYEFPDEYRLTEKQIHEYNKALMEANPIKRYINLDSMKSAFTAYPAFWYQIGSTANSIYRNDEYTNADMRSRYRAYAIKCFERYQQSNRFNLLRHDILASSCALEYMELQDMNQSHNADKAKELIRKAEQFSGNALDVLELCAFSYLRIGDYDDAIRLFHLLVNNDYNSVINTQLLSGLYIKMMRGDDNRKAADARFGYDQLKYITNEDYILKMPPKGMDLSDWKAEWNREENFDEFLEQQNLEKQKEKEKHEELKKKARVFYQKPILLVYKEKYDPVAEYFLGMLNVNREKIDPSLPSPSSCTLTDYKKNREKIERAGNHIIMIGDSAEAKKIYKNVNWEYDNLGMKYMSYGNKTILLTNTLKNNQLNDFIKLASKVGKKYKVDVPSDVASVGYTGMKEIFKTIFNNDITGTAVDVAIGTAITMIMSPLITVGFGLQNTMNCIQFVQNMTAKKRLDFLQYCFVIYKYLESKNAILN